MSLGGTRALAFERDYTAFLLALASSVRAGLDPLTAMIKSADLFPKASEVRRAILALKADIDAGCGEEAAFGRFAEDIRHPDIGLFSTAMVLARREGSSLGGCLERLAKVTRHRQSFRRKTRSAVAMQRLSAVGLAGIAVLIVGMQFIGNPESLSVALGTEFGRRALLMGGLAIAGGIIWMLRLARTRV
jgi:Flp pilus assembly protein TadB